MQKQSTNSIIQKLTRSTSEFLAWIGGALLLFMSIIIGFEVIARKFFAVSLGGTDELSGFTLAICTAFSLSYAFVRRAHIRIDSIYVLLRRPHRAALDILGSGVLLFFFTIVSWYAFDVFTKSWTLGARSMTPMRTPLAIPQGIWLLGLIVFLVVGSSIWARAVVALVRRDFLLVNELLGSRSTADDISEIEEEVLITNHSSAHAESEPKD